MRHKARAAVFLSAILITALVWYYQQGFFVGDHLSFERQTSKSKSAATEASKALQSQRQKKLQGLLKKENPDLFAQYHFDIRTRAGDLAPAYPQNYLVKELLRVKGLSSTKELTKARSKKAQLNWVERGPANVAGRTRGLLFDPTDASFNTWYAGSVGGGVWRTENAGQSWIELTAALTNLATSTLAMSISDPNVIYVGTGEGFFNIDQINGSGIWKTDDRGTSWEQLASTASNPQFQNITRIIVDPNDANTLLVSTAPGIHHFTNQRPSSFIFRSQDGGSTWTPVYDAGTNRVEQIVANSKNFHTQYATIRGVGVIKSTNGGQTWMDVSDGLNVVQRMELAVSPVDTSRLFISAEAGSSESTLYVSENGGLNWFAARNVAGWAIDWLAGIGWYSNAIAADPYSASAVFVGGVNIWRMEIQPGIDSSGAGPLGVEFENTDSFLSFIDFGGELAGGGIALGSATRTLFRSIEIRFGPGRSQKAHRFTVPAGASSGVPDSEYTYRDYVDVPFELWDVENDQQLMVSFRDQTVNGQWELQPFDTNTAREYLFLHAVPYQATPSQFIGQNGGHTFQQLYFIWPVLASSGVWNPSDLPEALLRIKWGALVTKRMTVANVTDGYGQFGGSSKGVHVDHHNILLVPTDQAAQRFRMLNANDGGVAYSDNGGLTFSQAINGYNTSQFYGVDKRNGANEYVGGMQDNSSWRSPKGVDADADTDWLFLFGGDGFEAVWHYQDPNKLLVSSQYNNIFRSLNEGATWHNANTNAGLTDVNDSAPFFTKIAKSKQDADLVFAVGASGVWRSDTFASRWELVELPGEWQGNRTFTDVKISLANPQVVWSAEAMVENRTPYVSIDGGLSFTPTNFYAEAVLGIVTGLETHPADERVAYALFSFAGGPKILKTTDLGQSWEDLSGFGPEVTSSNGFPDVAVFSLLVMPFDTNRIWAGTEIGIVESTDGGLSWAYADNGLPATAVFEMLIVNDQVVVATHGRGIWTVALPELSGYEPPVVALAPRLTGAQSRQAGTIETTLELRSPYDSSFVLVDEEKALALAPNPDPMHTTVSLPVASVEDGRVTATVASYRNGRQLKSSSRTVAVLPLLPSRVSYATDFDPAEDDFALEGFEITRPSGFANAGAGSPHPYPDDSELTMTLKFPIIVADQNATLKYEDIALVEPGAESTEFGDEDFWDFVIVEGSKDFGLTWQPLTDGYDARYDQDWLAAFNGFGLISSDLFRTHEINLLDTFAAQDQILIRFRLFADANVNGWGWIIDNIAIQDAVTDLGQGDLVPKVYSLSQNFPNPFNPSTEIVYSLPKPATVTLSIYNIRGQLIRRLLDSQQRSAGVHRVRWQGKDDAGRSVASGIYVYRMESNEFVQVRKMTFIK